MTAISQLCIPVQGFDEAVIIPFSQLPDLSPEELLDLLMSECAPLSMWMDFAKAYLAQNRTDQFKYMLQEGTSNEVAQEVEKFFGYKPLYEQIQFFCGLAALHMQFGQDERDKSRRQQHFADAQKAITKAQDLDSEEQLIYLARGMLHAAKGDLDKAGQDFTMATLKKNNKRPNIVAILALAALAFNQKKYQDALNLYKKALIQNPACPPEVRLGLAACYFRLGDLQMAQRAYERVLQLDPECTEAHLGLAIIKFNSSNIQQGLADGLKQLIRAYELDPHNTAVLDTLAHFCILRGNYQKALILANAAYKTGESDALKASCVSKLARAYHALGDFENAKMYYLAAVRLDQKLSLPRLGMAQMYIREGELKNAATELECMLVFAPGCYDGLMILGKLYPQMPNKVEKTISHFKEAAAKRPQDPEARELLSEILSATDPAAALEAMKATLAIHEKRREAANKKREAVLKKRAEANGNHDLFGEDDEEMEELPPEYHIPAKLLNNAAVLFYRSGQTEQALKLMEEAMKEMERADADNVAPMQKVTLIYNMARIHEASGNLEMAMDGYQSILKDFPTYIECYLRLACAARTKGDSKTALEWAQKAVDVEGGHADANALLGILHTGSRDYVKAKEVLDKLRAEDREDTYGRLALANLSFYAMLQERRKKDLQHQQAHLDRAQELYTRVLEEDPRNIYAANGVGAVLAERGHIDAAQEVFMTVQEAATASDGFLKLPDVWVNLANIYLAKRDYVSAIKMYLNTSAKFYHHKNAQVLLYLARAYYDSDNLTSARTCLLQALHVAPPDKMLWFNVALTMQEHALRVLKKERPTTDLSMLEEYSRAALDLEKAVRMFQQLKEGSEGQESVDKNKLDSHIKFCETTLQKARHYVTRAEKEITLLEAKRKANAEMISKQKQERELKAANAQYAEKKKKEEREAAARRQEERMLQLREQWRNQRNHLADDGEGGAERASKKPKKSKKKKEDDGFFVNEEEEYQPDRRQAEPGEYEGAEASDEEAQLRAAGLGSDTESGDARGREDEEGEVERRPSKSSKPKKKRLRMGGGARDSEAQGASGLEDDFAEDAEPEREPGETRKRLKRQTAVEDDDEDDGPEPGEVLADDDADEVLQDADDAPATQAEGDDVNEDDVDELFDDDD